MKNLERLKEEVTKLESEDSQRYPHYQAVWMGEVVKLIDQVEQPELLSQEWIDNHKVSRISNLRKMTMSDVVPVERLEGLLMPSAVDQPSYNDIFDRGYKDGYKTAKNQMPEQPTLPVVPVFIANQFETLDASGVQSEFSNVQHILSTAFSGEPEKEEHYSVLNWVYNNPEKYIDAARYGYTVEEKKYGAMIKGRGSFADSAEVYMAYEYEQADDYGRVEIEGGLRLVSKEYGDQRTMDDWFELGVNDDMADFEEVW